MILPERYLDVCKKLNALEEGFEFKIYDTTNKTKNMLKNIGAMICSIQKLDKQQILKDIPSHRCNKYNYKTNIKKLVDGVINKEYYNKQNENMLT